MGRACIENELNRKLHMRIILEIHDAQGRSNQININPTKKHTNSNQIKREHKTQIEQDRIKWNHSCAPPPQNSTTSMGLWNLLCADVSMSAEMTSASSMVSSSSSSAADGELFCCFAFVGGQLCMRGTFPAPCALDATFPECTYL